MGMIDLFKKMEDIQAQTYIRWLTYQMCCQNDKLHTLAHTYTFIPFKKESLAIIFSVISTCGGRVMTSGQTHTDTLKDMSGRTGALKIHSRELATSRQNKRTHNFKYNSHQMIYHFCIKRFASLLFWLWIFFIFCFANKRFFLFVSFTVLYRALITATATNIIIWKAQNTESLQRSEYIAIYITCTRIITNNETSCHWRQ